MRLVALLARLVLPPLLSMIATDWALKDALKSLRVVHLVDPLTSRNSVYVMLVATCAVPLLRSQGGNGIAGVVVHSWCVLLVSLACAACLRLVRRPTSLRWRRLAALGALLGVCHAESVALFTATFPLFVGASVLYLFSQRLAVAHAPCLCKWGLTNRSMKHSTLALVTVTAVHVTVACTLVGTGPIGLAAHTVHGFAAPSMTPSVATAGVHVGEEVDSSAVDGGEHMLHNIDYNYDGSDVGDAGGGSLVGTFLRLVLLACALYPRLLLMIPKWPSMKLTLNAGWLLNMLLPCLVVAALAGGALEARASDIHGLSAGEGASTVMMGTLLPAVVLITASVDHAPNPMDLLLPFALSFIADGLSLQSIL